ncbi:MAG: mechanosensitive ion channel family protein [Vicinamibacterales bacterium]
MERVLEKAAVLMPLAGAVAGVLLVLLAANWALLGRHQQMGKERQLPRQLVMLGLTVVGALVVLLSLPVSDGTRNQVIALVGVLLSGVIAFSSPTIVSNFMAGLMLRMTRPFRIGDFIRIGEHFGRVAERGLFDIEVQTEHRELISLPNTYVISNPVEVVRPSGTIVSATLSLGYDIHHARVEPLLVAAAGDAGLEEAFVQILELGNDAITYRVSGLLTEVRSLLSTRSNLYRAILDTLHGAGVEIVSPHFMNQRRLDAAAPVIPRPRAAPAETPLPGPEPLVFDKAERAAKREAERERLRAEIAELGAAAKAAGSAEKQALAAAIKEKADALAALDVESDEDEAAHARAAQAGDGAPTDGGGEAPDARAVPGDGPAGAER